MALVNGGPCGIYKFTSPTGRVYIGQSINIRKRLYYYKTLACKGQTKLYRSFIKYGYENHKFEIVKVCLKEELNEFEAYYIKLYDCVNTGLNLTSGGDHCTLSDETKAKIGNSHKNKIITEECRRKISNTLMGNIPWNKGIKTGKSTWNKGIKMSEATKQKMIAKKKGRPGRPRTREEIAKGWETRRRNKALKNQEQCVLTFD